MSRVARPVPTDPPTGTLVFSDIGNYASLARQQHAGRAVRLAPGIYVLRPRLPAAECAAHHLWAIVARFWPGAVVCDRSGLAGGAIDGWLYICQPVPARRADLRLPGVTVTCRVGPGSLPGDMRFPHGLHLSGSARGLVENISSGGRPPKNRPAGLRGSPQWGTPSTTSLSPETRTRSRTPSRSLTSSVITSTNAQSDRSASFSSRPWER